ncbi:MAG: phenylacetic acid degradation protein [Hoeflea sp.]|uniref:PaaI family thioesterase n=1 Tax=Hoeflea sp. TaxID=1940281 RepID=UPI000C10622A|nr:PaaI family thioesterase [Hoeflea sp.]PHR20622.1 MAG: phenylacetic acid degradation protein [Hoeflea sp.]
MSDTKDAERFAMIASVWNSRAKGLIAEMNLKIERANRQGVEIRMPFNPDFCLDEEGTMLHGGVLTALLDSAFGLANFLAIEDVQTMATLDLRVDYLRPASSRADVIVFAECYRQTRHIAFGSGKIWFDTGDCEEVARGSATFALTRGKGGLLDKMNIGGPGG